MTLSKLMMLSGKHCQHDIFDQQTVQIFELFVAQKCCVNNSFQETHKFNPKPNPTKALKTQKKSSIDDNIN